MKKLLRNKSGFTTLIFLSLLLMLSLLGINAIMTSTTDVNIAGYELNSTYALYSAEAGVEKAAAALTTYYNKFGRPPTTMPNDSIKIGTYGVKVTVTKSDTTLIKALTQGAYRGLYALVDEYTISATARTPGVQAATTVKATIDATLIPIYQFAVFYEQDLEIAPGPPMRLGGRVHSNNDMYLQANNELLIDSYTTAAGNLLWGRHPQSGQGNSSGRVAIKDANGNYQDMKNSDGTFLDARDPDWVNESISRWGGKVEDKEHGMTQLKLPVVASSEPMDMIKPAGSDNVDSFEHKAGLKIVNGQVFWRQPDSTWLNVTADFVSDGILTTTTFRDGRENKDVTAYDLDISRLNTSSYWPEGGIIYSSIDGAGAQTATRLKNGAELKEKLTVTSQNPVYTLGDYNTVNKKPAAIMTDALTILSNSWDDTKSWLGVNDRIAGNTTVNIAYLTGNVPSGTYGSNYSGGFENLPRFLENWTGKNFTWKGSAVVLWESAEARGAWSYGSYYTAPNRDWTYDLDFLNPNNLPPGTPLISVVLKTSWREITAPIVASN